MPEQTDATHRWWRNLGLNHRILIEENHAFGYPSTATFPPIPSLPHATSFLSFLAFLLSVRQVEDLPIFA
jgi:hypothetical protein